MTLPGVDRVPGQVLWVACVRSLGSRLSAPALLADRVGIEIGRDHEVGPQRAARGHRDWIDQRSVNQPVVVDEHLREQAWQRE